MPSPAAQTWNSRPVFISSTFNDMHDDRDYLRVHAFRPLEERLRERHHYLETIDLRQGVETSQVEEEAERDLKVLKVCLNEVERSRPFFVGLLGDRYGAPPPEDRMIAAAKVAGFDLEVAGRSLTELEILYGVLENQDQRKRSWFYIRELDYTGMPEHVRKQYDDQFADDPGAADRAKKLKALKRRLKFEFPDRVRTYRAKWDPEKEKVVILDDLARMVQDDLWSDIDPETEEWLLDAPKTWQEADARMLEDFVADRLRIVDGEIKGFVERDEVTRPLIEHALSPAAENGDWGICLTGEAGSGKSSLFARVYRELHQIQLKSKGEKLFLLAHAAGIYPTSGSVDTMLRRWIHELAGFLKVVDPLKAAEEQHKRASSDLQNLDTPLDRSSNQFSAEEIEKTFSSLLELASRKSRIVVLIDALNQFDCSTRTQYLTWLPTLWPENARFLATAIPDTESEAFAEKPGSTVKALEKMNSEEARNVAHQFYQERFRREPNERALDVLLEKTLPDGETLACSNPLWLELALQEMNLLEADDYKQADQDFPDLEGGVRIEALQVREADILPPDPVGMYGELLARAGRDFGESQTGAVMSLIALSRAGWRENDLAAIIPQVCGVPWDELGFAGLRRTLGRHILQRGNHGQWDCFHTQLRASVTSFLSPTDSANYPSKNLFQAFERDTLHNSIATYLESLPNDDPLRISETMFHAMCANETKLASRFLAYLSPRSSYVDPAVETLLESTFSASESTLHFILAMAKNKSLPLDQTRNLLNIVQLDVIRPTHTNPQIAVAILEACISRYRELTSQKLCPPYFRRDLAVALSNLAAQHERSGTISKGIEIASEALEILESLPSAGDIMTEIPLVKNRLRSLSLKLKPTSSTVQPKIDVIRLEKNLKQTREQMGKASSDPDSANIDTRYELAIALVETAAMRIKSGEFKEARYQLEEAIEKCDRLLIDNENFWFYKNTKASALNFLGEVSSNLGDQERALGKFSEAKHLREALIADQPRNLDLKSDLSVTYEMLGDACLRTKDFEQALHNYESTKEIREKLVDFEPKNGKWCHNLWIVYFKMVDAFIYLGRLQEAERYCMISIEIARKFAASSPDDLSLRANYGSALEARGGIYAIRGEYRKALADFDEALTIYGNPSEIQKASLLANYAVECCKGAIEVCRRTQQSDEERNYLRKMRNYQNQTK